MACENKRPLQSLTISRAEFARIQQASAPQAQVAAASVAQRNLPPPVSASSSKSAPLKKGTLPEISPKVEMIDPSCMLQNWLQRKGTSIVRGTVDPDKEGGIDPIEEVAVAHLEDGSCRLYAEATGRFCLKIVGITEEEIRGLHANVRIPADDLMFYFKNKQNTLYLTLSLDHFNRLDFKGEFEHSLQMLYQPVEEALSYSLAKASTQIEEIRKIEANIEALEAERVRRTKPLCDLLPGIPSEKIEGFVDRIGLCLQDPELIWHQFKLFILSWRKEVRMNAWKERNTFRTGSVDFREHRGFNEIHTQEDFREDLKFYKVIEVEARMLYPLRANLNQRILDEKKKLSEIKHSLSKIEQAYQNVLSQKQHIETFLSETQEEWRLQHQEDIETLKRILPEKSFVTAYLRHEREPSVISFAKVAAQGILAKVDASSLNPIVERIDASITREQVFAKRVELFSESVALLAELGKKLGDVISVDTPLPKMQITPNNPKWQAQIDACWKAECFRRMPAGDRIAQLTLVKEKAIVPLRKHLLEKKAFLEQMIERVDICALMKQRNQFLVPLIDPDDELKVVLRELGALGIKERTINNLIGKAEVELKLLQSNPLFASIYNNNKKASLQAGKDEEKS